MNDLNICKTCIWFDDAACRNNQRICVDNREYFMQFRVSGDIVRSLYINVVMDINVLLANPEIILKIQKGANNYGSNR